MTSLYSRMMDLPLMISSIMDYAADVRSDVEIVSQRVEGDLHRYTYSEASVRTAQLAYALQSWGVLEGDRIATLAWNGYRHLELYFAIAGIGAVCHTINPRLFPEQLVYIINHAKDRILFLEVSFVPLIFSIIEELPKDLKFVLLCSKESMPESKLPNVHCFEDLLIGQPKSIEWPTLDERSASGLCYTSGTTGNPKGVLFSHRSTLLHTLGMLVFGAEAGLTQNDVVLPVVPLFHANAWGLPFATPLVGAKLVLPGPNLDGESLFNLMDSEVVTSAWGVPTIWLGLLEAIRKHGRKPRGFRVLLTGGAAAPRSMIEEFEIEYGVSVLHGWGMTEMSPIGATSSLNASMRAKPIKEQIDLKSYQGRRMYTVDWRIVDENGIALPHDGQSFGELQVKGHGVMNGYHEDEEASSSSMTKDGWLKTGDIAKITVDGFLILVDRTKDVIKSGGEWISSIELENTAQAHPDIIECAVIAIPHPRWGERPLLIVTLVQGATLTGEDIIKYLSNKVAKWWLPEDVIFVDELPHTATGKLSKLTLRERFKNHVSST